MSASANTDGEGSARNGPDNRGDSPQRKKVALITGITGQVSKKII